MKTTVIFLSTLFALALSFDLSAQGACGCCQKPKQEAAAGCCGKDAQAQKQMAADCCGTKSKAKKDGEKSAHECGMCKMDTAKSQTRIIINLKDKTVIEACCLGCGNHLYNKNLANVESIQIYDYESKQMVDALKASFVIKSKKEPKRSMWPYAIAFADKSKAEAFVAKHQGEITDFNGAVAYIKAEKKAKEDAKEPAKSK